jgi:hypothetical protein
VERPRSGRSYSSLDIYGSVSICVVQVPLDYGGGMLRPLIVLRPSAPRLVTCSQSDHKRCRHDQPFHPLPPPLPWHLPSRGSERGRAQVDRACDRNWLWLWVTSLAWIVASWLSQLSQSQSHAITREERRRNLTKARPKSGARVASYFSARSCA